MQLKIHHFPTTATFPDDKDDLFSEETFSDGKHGEKVFTIRVTPNHLIAEIIWQLADQLGSSGQERSIYQDVEGFFPLYGLMLSKNEQEPLPFLNTLKELSIKGSQSMILVGMSFGHVEQEMIPKEFNERANRKDALLDQFFRWTPEKLDQLISNVIEANELTKYEGNLPYRLP